jgi:aspartyl aminopeptidase
MAGAHTDSPCLKIKPKPEFTSSGYVQLGVEVYGGALFNPWFDRDLSIAGKVSYRSEDGSLESGLVNLADPVAVIPSLAIHLDREANTARTVNAQKHLPPLLLQKKEKSEADDNFALKNLLKNVLSEAGHKVDEVLDHDLCLYDVQAPALVGLNREFIASARLDNLLSCFVGLQALIDSDGDRAALLVCNDHEEIGSESVAGAHGPFLESVLQRLAEQLGGNEKPLEVYRRMISHSFMVSMDNAHGIHPNYSDKHDPQHGPLLNSGPVIKVNANQRYATNSTTAALFRQLADSVNEPVQSFVMRSDMGCGSTIGPIVATELGVDTIDVGVPTFAMHSIRELAGSKDAEALYRIMQAYYAS